MLAVVFDSKRLTVKDVTLVPSLNIHRHDFLTGGKKFHERFFSRVKTKIKSMPRVLENIKQRVTT